VSKTVFRGSDLVAFFSQQQRKYLTDALIVVHHKDAVF